MALRAAVLRAGQDPSTAVFPTDALAGALHLAARDGDAIVAVGSIAPEPHPHDPRPGDWRIRGMAADPAARGQGLGSAILAGLIAHARAQDGRRVWCNARTPALSLYVRAGLIAEGREFLTDAGVPHFLMVLELT